MGMLIALYTALLLPAVLYWALRGRRERPVGAGRGRRRGEGLSIDSMAYSSRLCAWNPGFKAALSVLTIFLCIALDDPRVSAAVLFAMAALVVEVGGLPFGAYLRTLAAPLTFILLGALAIGIEYSKTPAGDYRLFLGFGYLYTTPVMLQKSAFLTLKVLAAVSALELLILTTPSGEIISVLQKIRTPKLLVDLMHMIYRYIFILLDVFARMRNAAESRLGYRDLKTSYRTFGSIASNLLVRSLRRSGAYYDAMEARCYTGELAFLEKEKPVRPWQLVGGAAFLLYLPLLRYLVK